MKKFLKVFCAIVCFTCLTSIVSFADWVQDGENWKYDNRGEFIVSNFKQIDGKYYYFDAEGHMVKGVYNIDGEYYVFNDDGTADTDGITIMIESEVSATGSKTVDYKTTLKGKIVNQDDISMYEEELEDAIKLGTAYVNEKAAREANANMATALSVQLGAITEGEKEGWNKIGTEYRFVKDNKKFAHCYEKFNFATQGYNTIYFDDLGNAKPLNWVKTDLGHLQLALEQGQAEYTDSNIYIFGQQLIYSFNDKIVSKNDFERITSYGFNIDTYKASIIAELEGLYNQQIQKENDKLLDELKAEQSKIEQANALKISSSTQSIKTIKIESDLDDGKSKGVRINMRIPVFIGNNSEQVNAAVSANYENTVFARITQYANELGAETCPKEIGVPNPTISLHDNILTINVSSNICNTFYIKYNLTTNVWDEK